MSPQSDGPFTQSIGFRAQKVSDIGQLFTSRDKIGAIIGHYRLTHTSPWREAVETREKALYTQSGQDLQVYSSSGTTNEYTQIGFRHVGTRELLGREMTSFIYTYCMKHMHNLSAILRQLAHLGCRLVGDTLK